VLDHPPGESLEGTLPVSDLLKPAAAVHFKALGTRMARLPLGPATPVGKGDPSDAARGQGGGAIANHTANPQTLNECADEHRGGQEPEEQLSTPRRQPMGR
jgi:hypothetical protein